MFHKKKSIAVIVAALLISIGSSPLSHADDPIDPNTYTAASSGADIQVVLAPGSTITIDADTVDIQNNVFTFTSYDSSILAKVPDPENYVLLSSGVLLQSKSGSIIENAYKQSLTDLLAENQIANQTVTDLSAVAFDFTVSGGETAISLDFILASNESVQGDWDLAGIFIDGVNYAFLPNGQLLRVNESAQITDVCDIQSFTGCFVSNYALNGVTLGTMSPKLTLNAQLTSTTGTHTFVAIMANTNDTAYPSSLLFGNFQTIGAVQQLVSTFSFGIQIEEVIEEEVVVVAPPLPDPNQLSTITGTTVSTADSSGNVTITVAGSFPETVRNIDVNGRRIAPSSWVQESSTVTFTVPAATSGSYEVQIWNGSFPVLQVQTVIATK
jgi:hypothetical protein